ncbi:MAG: hypothetical protein ACN6O2_15695 [Stenotrophomonas sp.]
MRRFVFTLVGLLPALCAGLIACASSPSAWAAKANFDGEWSVEWCDRTAPEADCGGFTASLVQDGDRLCGDYSGARVRLTQIDEGGRILGIVIGSTAVLTIESERSGGIYLVQASVDGDRMDWKMRDTVRRADHDIDIIAQNDELKRRTLDAGLKQQHARVTSECQAGFQQGGSAALLLFLQGRESALSGIAE